MRKERNQNDLQECFYDVQRTVVNVTQSFIHHQFCCGHSAKTDVTPHPMPLCFLGTDG